MGKSSSPPPAPDYAGLSETQARLQNEQLATQTSSNRPTQNTPWGTSSWTQSGPTGATGGTFNQAGYDAAMAKYNAGSAGTPATNGYYETIGGGDNEQQVWRPGTPATAGSGPSGPAPTRAQFTTGGTAGNPGGWTQNITLNPAEQALLDQQRRITTGLGSTAEGLLGQAQTSLQNPLSTDGLPAWMNYNFDALQDVDPSQLTEGIGEMGPQADGGSLGSLAGDYGPMGNLAANYGDMGSLANDYGAFGQLRGNYGEMGDFDPSRLSEQGQYNTDALSAWGETPIGGNFNMSASGNSKAIQDATYKLTERDRQQARDGEVQRLKNQGLTEDSPAFQRALSRLDEQDTRAQMQALLAGQTEYGNQFNRSMSSNAQNYNQRAGSAMLANSLRGQQFGEQTSIADLANRNRAQQTDEQLSRADLLSRNNQQRYEQDIGQGTFNNQTQAQRFNQGLSRANFDTSNQAQRFNQGLSRAEFGNDSQAQRFGQGLDRATYDSANQQQRFNQSAVNSNMRTGQQQQRFNQNLAGQNLASMLRAQQFGEQGAQANLNNTQRGAMLQERQAIRQSPLNDLRSLMGNAVQNPQFANFMGAGQGQGQDVMGAANAAYQAQMNNFNAGQQGNSNLMSGLFGLGGAALGNPMLGGMIGKGLSGLFGG